MFCSYKKEQAFNKKLDQNNKIYKEKKEKGEQDVSAFIEKRNLEYKEALKQLEDRDNKKVIELSDEEKQKQIQEALIRFGETKL